MNLHPVTQDNGKPDRRYTVTREWVGHPKPRFVVRFCDEWVGHNASYPEAVLRAVGHNNVRKGATVIEEIKP